jgi:D-glycero-D-manno-heptose 1,7-bisphosphate phosphatase
LGRLYAFRAGVKLGVFIERDGVLNKARIERGRQVSPLALEDFHVNTEAAPLLKRLKAAGLMLFATTNQPGLSRGYQSRRELDRMHDALRAALPLDGILVCPHDEVDHCPCRKPKPGLMVEAGFEHRLYLDHSFVISDKWLDAEAARTLGCISLMLESPWLGTAHRDFVLPDLGAIVEKILVLRKARSAATV